MKLGAVFPTTEIGKDPAAIRDWAQAAEELGYDHILTYDHVLGAEHANREPALGGPYDEDDPFHEPMTLLAYLAGVTQRIELVTGVIITPQRQTVLLAKQAAQIDLLSNGRLRLGLGSGWNYTEYEALGVPFARRGKRLSEQVELIRKLWTGELLDYSGEFHRVDRAKMLPYPERPIPIWLGGFAKPAIRRAARIGDGLLLGTPPSVSRKMVAVALEVLEREGRDRATFGSEAIVDFSFGPERWASEIATWRELGGTHLTLRAMDTAAELVGGRRMDYAGPQAYIDAMTSFRAEADLGRSP